MINPALGLPTVALEWFQTYPKFRVTSNGFRVDRVKIFKIAKSGNTTAHPSVRQQCKRQPTAVDCWRTDIVTSHCWTVIVELITNWYRTRSWKNSWNSLCCNDIWSSFSVFTLNTLNWSPFCDPLLPVDVGHRINSYLNRVTFVICRTPRKYIDTLYSKFLKFSLPREFYLSSPHSGATAERDRESPHAPKPSPTRLMHLTASGR